MKYRELLAELETLKEEQLDMDVTVYVPFEEEYFAVDNHLWYADEDNDVLDKDSPIIYIQ